MTEYLVWKNATSFDICYTEEAARKHCKKIRGGDIEKIEVSRGGLILSSEIINKDKK